MRCKAASETPSARPSKRVCKASPSTHSTKSAPKRPTNNTNNGPRYNSINNQPSHKHNQPPRRHTPCRKPPLYPPLTHKMLKYMIKPPVLSRRRLAATMNGHPQHRFQRSTQPHYHNRYHHTSTHTPHRPQGPQ
jgi:hypothetical protein